MDLGAPLNRTTSLLLWAIAVLIVGLGALVVHDDGRETTTPAAAANDGDGSTTVSTNPGDVVAALHGDGSMVAETTIHVEGRWQLRWHVDGGTKVDVTATTTPDGKQLLVASLTPGDGSLDVDRGCDCALHVTPNGATYDVTVVEVAD